MKSEITATYRTTIIQRGTADSKAPDRTAIVIFDISGKPGINEFRLEIYPSYCERNWDVTGTEDEKRKRAIQRHISLLQKFVEDGVRLGEDTDRFE
jgi:hypothetical protein